MKTCSNPDCKQTNPQLLEQFKKKDRYKDGIYPRCKSCELIASRLTQTKNREQINLNNRIRYHRDPVKYCSKSRLCRFKAKYWPTLSIKEVESIWNAMYIAQKGNCSICKKPKLLEVEHCHITGKVRSLACNGCNTALARINEDIEIAKALIVYIETHNETNSKSA